MTATPIEDAQVVHEPDPDFAGEDGLDYKITIPIGQAAQCHVRFEVVEPIVAVDDTAETEVDEPVAIDVLANDYPLDDHPYVVITREPEHGTVVEADEDGVVTYRPDEGFEGTDTFEYYASDNIREAGYATVTVTVGSDTSTSEPEPDPPADPSDPSEPEPPSDPSDPPNRPTHPNRRQNRRTHRSRRPTPRSRPIPRSRRNRRPSRSRRRPSPSLTATR